MRSPGGMAGLETLADNGDAFWSLLPFGSVNEARN